MPQPYSRKTSNLTLARAGTYMRKEALCHTSDSVFLLPQTGFHIDSQIEVNAAAYERHRDINTFQREIITKNREDLLSFYWEYLKQEPVLPIPLSFDSRGDIICPRYDNVRLTDTVSATERAGTVKSNIVKLNSLLHTSPDNTSFVFTSPPGWSGYDGITYPNSQTYFYQKSGDEIQSMTVVTSMTLEQNKQLIQKLTGKKFMNNGGRQAIIETTGTLMSLPNFGIHELISEIETVTNKQLDIVHAAANKNPEIDESISQILHEFELFIEENIFDMEEASREKLQKELGKVVLQMQNVTARGKLPKSEADYVISLKEVQEISGCNGGGYIETAFGPREVEYDFSLWGICMAGGCHNPNAEKWLGPCKICEECDALIRSGKTLSPKIREQIQVTTEENGFHSALLPLAFAAFIAGLFSKN